MADHVSKTIEVYNSLGKQYVDSVANAHWGEIDEFKQLVKSGQILDVGCAGGRDSRKFLKAGFKVVGIDLVGDFLKIAKSDCPGGEFIKMDIRDLKFSSDKFDGIWASMALLHLTEQECFEAIKDFSRILKRDGCLFIGLKEGEAKGYLEDSLTPGKKRFFKCYALSEIEEILKQNKFEIISANIESDNLGRDQRVIKIIARNIK